MSGLAFAFPFHLIPTSRESSPPLRPGETLIGEQRIGSQTHNRDSFLLRSRGRTQEHWLSAATPVRCACYKGQADGLASRNGHGTTSDPGVIFGHGEGGGPAPADSRNPSDPPSQWGGEEAA